MRLLTILLLLAIASTASGQFRDDAPPAYSVMQGGGATLEEAIEQVRHQTNGRIVDARTVVNNCRETHVIKVLTEDGKVITKRVPGKRTC